MISNTQLALEILKLMIENKLIDKSPLRPELQAIETVKLYKTVLAQLETSR